MSYQNITPGFAVKKVGLALQTLGYVNKERNYATIFSAKSPKDLKLAYELVSGTQGAENLNHFWLCMRLTFRRLASFVEDF